MRNLLTLIFTALLLFLLAELGFYFYLSQPPQTQTKNPPTPQISSFSNPIPTPTPLSEYKSYQEWQPNVVASIVNPSRPDKLEYNVRALIKSIDPEKKQIEAIAADNKTYLFQIAPTTVFYTVTVFVNQPPIQKQEGSFADLTENQVVLFTWEPIEKTDNLERPILVSSVMIKR